MLVSQKINTIVIHQHLDFFQVMTGRSLIYEPNLSRETWLSKKEDDD